MIRIVNTTGRADDTQVLDAATGEDLTARLCITKIELVLDAGPRGADVAIEVVQAE